MNKKRYLVIVGVVAAAVVVVLAILFDVVLANHEPIITNLAVPEKVLPSGTCQITCHASDRDGDVLSYNWSASGGDISGTGAVVNWTAPVSVGSCNVTVAVTDGRGGEIVQQVTIEVRGNRAPIITSLVADTDWALPSGSIRVICTASDPDDDELAYEWMVSGGDVSGTGTAVNWTAPEEVGVYNVTVVVKDGHAAEDTMFTPLSVNLDTPPVIEELIVNPKGHIYLRECTADGCDYDVWKTREYDIECVASPAGEVVCDWSCTDGAIAGEGSKITWTAPTKTLTKATVTLIVSDAAGNSVAKNIVFYVPSCTCGSW